MMVRDTSIIEDEITYAVGMYQEWGVRMIVLRASVINEKCRQQFRVE